MPAIVNANLGYASGTTDAGQPWYQDGSFAFLSNGKVNAELLKDFSVRAMVEQAVKTKALVSLYYGKAPKYSYYDGHSQGGRQGMKIMQEYPELYDGYLIAQPAPNIAKFGTSALYPQIVMKTELGYTAIDKDNAKAFAAKVAAANLRAVAACDTAGLGFLLDPFACNYNPARDAAALCTGAAGDGVTGSNADTANCLSAKEATAINKIWYGLTPDGSFDAAQTADSRSGKALGARQVWWTFTRGTAIGGQITSAGADNIALALQDVSYAADASATSAIPITNGSTAVRNKWLELDYVGLADAVAKNVALQPTLLSDLITDKADLTKLRDLGRKVVVWSGLADDAIPPAGNVNYHERVLAAMGGNAEVAEVHADVSVARRRPQFARPRLHGRRQERHRAAAETARQRQPDAGARAGSVLHCAGGLGREGCCARRHRADLARQEHQLPHLRLSAAHDMERPRTGDASGELQLPVDR